MKKPPADPDVADVAPTDSVLTVYDEEHIVTYLRMLDADAEGARWRNSYCISIPSVTTIAQDVHSIATWPAQNG